MDSTRVLAAPGIRTGVYLGWRSRVATAFWAVINEPQLWLLGMIGFCLRGGIILLTLPIIILPTPVEVRLLLGDYLGTTGFSDRFWLESALVALVASVLTLGVLAILARVEASAFDRLSLGDDAGRVLRSRALPVRLLGVQVLTFIATFVAAAPLAKAAVESAYNEIVRPTSSAPIYERVIATLGQELFLLVVAIVVIETISALATRQILAAQVRPHGAGSMDRWSLVPALGGAIGRIARAPLRTLGTAALGWSVTIALVVPGLGAIVLAWAGVRATFLTSVSFSDLREDLGMLLMAVALAAALVLAMALGGFASALRAALWSVDRLR